MRQIIVLLIILILVLAFIALYYKLKYSRTLKFLTDDEFEHYLKTGNFNMYIPSKVIEIIRNIVNSVGAEYSSEMLNKQIEYSTLQSQINPHFLYNTLEAIRGEALLANNNNIANMAERLSRFFRYSISNKGDVVTIGEELENVKDYFYIQQYRFEDKFTMENDISQDCLDYYIPKMTLQPLVENSIYHGLEYLKHGGKVTIHISSSEKIVKIVIKDNGIGITEDKLIDIRKLLNSSELPNNIISSKKNKGIALYNVNSRIKLFFGHQYGMTLRSSEGIGTEIEIIIPKIESVEEHISTL